MKKILTILLLLLSFQGISQNYGVQPSINASTIDWHPLSWFMPYSDSAKTFTESVTYAQLASKISAKTLFAGKNYIITDYQTIHLIPTTTDTNKGAVEPLLVMAISDSTLSSIAYSTLHKEDIIYYSPINDQTMVPGCTKGYISRRIDTKQVNDFPFDFRAVKFRRWQIIPDTWSVSTSYDKGAIVKGTTNAELYVALDTTKSNPVTDASHWNLFAWAYGDYVSPTTGSWSLVNDVFTVSIPCSGLYVDYLFLSDFATNYSSCTKNTFSGNGTNILANCNFVVFGPDFINNSIGLNFYNNSIGPSFINNSIGHSFYNNSIGLNFYDNSIGLNFTNNSIGANYKKQQWNNGSVFVGKNVTVGDTTKTPKLFITNPSTDSSPDTLFSQVNGEVQRFPLTYITNQIPWTSAGGKTYLKNINDNVGIGTTTPLHRISVLTSKATNVNGLNIVQTDWNKNRSTLAQATDTSNFNFYFTNGGKPMFNMRNNTGVSVLSLDSSGVLSGMGNPIRYIIPLHGTCIDSTSVNTSIKYVMGYSSGFVIDTIIYVNYVTGAGSASVTPKIRFGTSIADTGRSVVYSPTAVTSTTTATKRTAFNNATIPAGNIVWLTFTATATIPRNFSAIIIGHRI